MKRQKRLHYWIVPSNVFKIFLKSNINTANMMTDWVINYYKPTKLK